MRGVLSLIYALAACWAVYIAANIATRREKRQTEPAAGGVAKCDAPWPDETASNQRPAQSCTCIYMHFLTTGRAKAVGQSPGATRPWHVGRSSSGNLVMRHAPTAPWRHNTTPYSFNFFTTFQSAAMTCLHQRLTAARGAAAFGRR
jgi:hypothetical protein